MDINLASNIAKEAVKNAGKLLMDHYGKPHEVSLKGKSDIVTDIDIASEKIILDAIKKHFPDHSILSEEGGGLKYSEKYLWITDPIDGTINYYYGAAPFRVALCLLEDKNPIITAIYNPLKDHLYFAQKGKGATMNGKKITVSNNSELKNSVIMAHLSSKREARVRTISVLDNIFSKSMHMRVFGSVTASMTYIASGKFDVFFNVKNEIWDILPGAFLVQEAGGIVTDVKGNKINYESDSVLATNGKVHKEMLKLLENI